MNNPTNARSIAADFLQLARFLQRNPLQQQYAFPLLYDELRKLLFKCAEKIPSLDQEVTDFIYLCIEADLSAAMCRLGVRRMQHRVEILKEPFKDAEIMPVWFEGVTVIMEALDVAGRLDNGGKATFEDLKRLRGDIEQEIERVEQRVEAVWEDVVRRNIGIENRVEFLTLEL